ncbi:unnamed protein product [Eruca vesicaria subsp. sativa]|uniref:Uncharacterized protein n=1 Tax=Eruca vesicaria subsp. sativa TaxID=29727 RepID=A0ABC8LD07_ERUVS|nr:unnamed protein product [Eruca vesicaria subsp. sativa]
MAKTLINSIYLSPLLIVLLVSNGLPKAKGQTQLCFEEQGPADACTPTAVVTQECEAYCKSIDPTWTGQCDFNEPANLHCHCYEPC